MGERRGTKALELWCRRMTEGYPGVKIDNMTTSWRDGLAFCAMIHHFRPDLIEFDKLNKADVYYNNELAFTTAEKYLGIPALLDADDMANYEVPDRLSILTYLSQYYQVFAAQDSSNRLKRSSSSTEKTQISKPAGPPSKMAHVVGVPRRDPCQKCQLPVFLAERLTVGKKVFHRTCLKCARCGSQLTIGSFYETEVDDVFCCETCPDEEEFDDGLNNGGGASCSSSSNIVLRHDNEKEITNGSIKSTRSSIADRLAFFEQNKANSNSSSGIGDSKLLQKSVSDEEKSKGLQSREAEATTPYKMNPALSNFLNDTIDGEEPNETEESSEVSSYSAGVDNIEKDATAMEISDTESDSEENAKSGKQNLLPSLPLSEPPAIEKESEEIVTTPSKRFTATAQLNLSEPSETNLETEEKPTPIKTESKTSPQASPITTTPADKTELSTESEAHKSQTQNLTTINDLVELRESNLNECVTKDINVDATQILGEGVAKTEEKDEEEEMGAVVELRQKSGKGENDGKDLKENLHSNNVEDKATTERLSVVRARLQQFEEITNINNNSNSSTNNKEIDLKSTCPEKDNLISKDVNVNDKIKLSEVKEEKENDDDENKNENENVDIEMASNATPTEKIANIEESMPKSMQQESSEDIEISNEHIREEILGEANKIEKTTSSPTPTPRPSPRHVPSSREKKDEILIESKEIKENNLASYEGSTTPQPIAIKEEIKRPQSIKAKADDYPEDLNPFKSDDEEDSGIKEENKENRVHSGSNQKTGGKSSVNANPFDSSDDEIELEKPHYSASSTPKSLLREGGKVRPPRPPPPRISRNPFEGDTDNEGNFSRGSSLSSSARKRTPIPTPRTNLDYYGSYNSLGATTPLHRNSDIRGSNNSLTSSSGGTVRSRKNRKAPAPPTHPHPPTVKELFPSTETLGSSKTSTPSSSTVGSPKTSRKKRPAPAPPKPARLESNILPQLTHEHETNGCESKNLHSYPLQGQSESKLSDEEKALLEGKTDAMTTTIALSPVPLRSKNIESKPPIDKLTAISRRNSRRIIPLDPTLLRDAAENAHEAQCDDQKQQQLIDQHDDHNVVYRRVIMPPSLNTPEHERNSSRIESLHSQDRQSEKLKDNKETKNRNRQSQQSASSGAEDTDPSNIYNKSAHGKWKRRKGPAPALPIPPRKVLQMLPLQEIRHELDIIEVQQQGLEKQGVVLEKMIRDRCEGKSGEPINSVTASALTGAGDGPTEGVQNSKEVEDLILQLFELVNEKNELFRRQAELMYLRRQHRLEQEQADLEYEIRVLMAQPERNKTDSDKAREEALIARLVQVVQLRNEVVECLEMDRLREAEEDLSIKQRLEQHTAKREGLTLDENSKKNTSKLSKKEKKKQKEAKKLSKTKNIDVDKDADESELSPDKQKLKKKKRKFLF